MNPETKVGELRPSQLLFSFGVGATVDLPNISAMVMGLDDWDTSNSVKITEERLLGAVRGQLGHQVESLLSPPYPPVSTGFMNPFETGANVGVPVAPFPRWMLCPYCRLLAPLKSDLFTLKPKPFRPDRTSYVHENCRKPGKPPVALPARFLLACERGHLDDFPWVTFVHRGETNCRFLLRLREYGVSGEAGRRGGILRHLPDAPPDVRRLRRTRPERGASLHRASTAFAKVWRRRM